MVTCSACGAGIPASSRFCVHCGAAVHAPAPSSAQAPVTSGTGRSRKPLLITGAVVAAVIAVGGGALVAQGLLGDDGGRSATGFGAQRQHVSAVTSSPTEAWTWTGSGDGVGLVADGDLLLAQSYDENGTLTRLDPDGDVVWEQELPDGHSLAGLDAGAELVWTYEQWEGVGVGALSTETGEEEWSNPDYSYAHSLGQGRIVASAYEEGDEVDEDGFPIGRYAVAVIDSDGDVLWDRKADHFVADGSDVFLVEDDTLTSLDPDTGEDRWSVQLDLDTEEDLPVRLVVNEGIVAVAGSHEILGLDPEDGRELWQEEDLWGYDALDTLGRHLVVSRSGDSETYEDGEAIVYSAEGELDRVRLDPDEYDFSGIPLRLGDEHYFARSEDGVIYDEELTPVGRFEGDLTPAGDGYYQLFKGELSYRELEGGERWSRQVADEYASVVPLEGKVLVVEDDLVTAYE